MHTAQPWGCLAMQVRPCTLFACNYGKGGTLRRQISVHMLYVRVHTPARHILPHHNKAAAHALHDESAAHTPHEGG